MTENHLTGKPLVRISEIKEQLPFRIPDPSTAVLIGQLLEQSDIAIAGVKTTGAGEIPVPYVLSNGKRALLVAGNPSDTKKNLTLHITPDDLGFPAGTESLRVTELWPLEGEGKNMKISELRDYAATIPADGKTGGGLFILRLETIQSAPSQ